MKNWDFFRALHGRGETVQTLADKIQSSRSHVNQVLANKPGRGGQTRRKLIPLLTEAELKHLGWFHTEQSSTQGNVRDAVERVPTERKENACSM